MPVLLTFLQSSSLFLYFWLNLKLKREQEIAVESMLMNQGLVLRLPTAYGKS